MYFGVCLSVLSLALTHVYMLARLDRLIAQNQEQINQNSQLLEIQAQCLAEQKKLNENLEKLGMAAPTVAVPATVHTSQPKHSYYYKDGKLSNYVEADLMTVKMAANRLQMSRERLRQLRDEGKLISLYDKRNVRLIRKDVEEAYEIYTRYRR
ncbi:hypothetical protein SAMN05216436_11674 [bacterium A37T11]|nr:hypothetical protein SAMN05216436_11674 [bacterium A37T11]